jgi:type VI secretion system protein ImpE
VSAHELFRAGKLTEAVAAAADEVKKHPSDTARRLLLAELLCFTGDLERADKHLDAASGGDPQSMTWIIAFRQLIRAEQARQGFHSEGRLPSFLGQPEGALRLLLEASVQTRGGDAAAAAALLEQAEAERPKVTGTCDGQAFADFRDLDDQTCCVLEVLTVKGDYYWVPFDRVESVDFRAPERPRDLLWRTAHLVVRDGPDSEVFLPALYPGAAAEADDPTRLGRATDWRGGDGAPVRGVGQRTFLVGEEARTIMELKTLAFDAPPGGAEPAGDEETGTG